MGDKAFQWAIRVEAFGRPLTLEFSFGSRYNATNALAAIAAYNALGLPLGKLQKGARHVQLSRLRGEEVPLPQGGVLINDCYNANPLSMAAALTGWVSSVQRCTRSLPWLSH